jgi:hypothetical protein
MPRIKFSHIFHDYFERILHSFGAVSISNSDKNPVTNIHFHKGQYFDEDNAEFSFCWKNYYEIKMVVEKVFKSSSFKRYTHRTIYIDKLPIILSFTYNFYWDSINEATILIIDLDYQDDFFTDLIKADFSDEDKLNICKLTEQYLSMSIKGLETNTFCCLDASINKAKKYLLYPYAFFKIVSKDLIIIPNENEVSLDETYELFTKSENSSELIPLTVYIVSSIYISSDFIKIIYNTYKKISFPNIKISFSLRQLENKKCLFEINIKPNEQTNFEMSRHVYRFWKKQAIEFSNIFDKNKNKKKV